MKIFKRISMLLVVAIVALTLVACKDNNTDKQDVAAAKELLVVADLLGSNESATAVISNLVFKTRIGESVDITWSSNNKDVIADNGRVIRSLEEDKEVEITATLKKGNATDTKKFEFTVLKGQIEAKTVTAAYPGGSTIKFSEDAKENNAGLIKLDPTLFEVRGTVIDGGSYTNPIGLNTAGQIRLYASRNDGLGNVLQIKVAEGYKIQAVEFDFDAGNNNPFMGELYLGKTSEALEAKDIANTTLKREGLSVDGFTLANNQQGGTASTQIWIKSIKITYIEGTPESVLPAEKTDKELLDAAVAALLIEDLLGANESKDEITRDLTFPKKLGNVTVAWTTNNTDVIDADGKVVRPADADATVKLTATLTIGEEEATKDFDVKVLKAEEGVLQAEAKYEAGAGTTTMTEGNNAELLGLDKDLFNVVSTGRTIAPVNQHIGLNNAGDIRIYGNKDYIGKNTLAITIGNGYIITGVEIAYKAGSNSPTHGLLTLGNDMKQLTAEDIISTTKVYNELSIDGFSLRNNQDGGTGNSQIWIESILITYEEGVATSKFVPVPTNEVKFNTDGASEIKSYFFEDGDDFKLPGNPKKDGFDFDGWYLEDTFTTKVDLEYVVTEDVTLYAKWLEKDDQGVVDAAKAALTIDTEDITEDKTLTLPVEGLNNVVITWTVTEGADLIDLETGKVTMPEESKTLKLKATLTLNAAETTKEFTINLVYVPVVEGETEVILNKVDVNYTTTKDDETVSIANKVTTNPNIEIFAKKGGTGSWMTLRTDDLFRMYGNKADGNGNTLTIQVKTGFKLTGLEITYTVTNSATVEIKDSEGNIISEISSGIRFMIDSQIVTIQNNHTTSGSVGQFKVTGMKIYYIETD